MADVTLRAPARLNLSSALFTAAIFLSASLVFLVQPMIAKMLLPRLGGSPAVWNTSMAFFQAALLLGYGYAHLLQRLPGLRAQAITHLCVLALAGAILPLSITQVLGEPPPSAPVGWLLGVLALSVGAPFAVLSATAPLVQAWFARLNHGRPEGENPYVLYAASNVGSMLALLAYPLVVEPNLALGDQTSFWTFGYGAFTALVAGLALAIFRAGPIAAPELMKSEEASGAVTWRARTAWILLSAGPSSLMLGVTTFISTDVAATPFFWVLPLALYLLTFIVAFQAKPAIPARVALFAQGVLVPMCLLAMPFNSLSWWLVIVLHCGAFFFTALVCHQALAARKPDPRHLTEFYLCLSLGGVIGGAATALLAPVIFETVLEYPLVLVLAGLARPLATGRPERADWIVLFASIVSAGALAYFAAQGPIMLITVLGLAGLCALAAVLLRPYRLMFTTALAVLAVLVTTSTETNEGLATARTFFGVHRVGVTQVPELGGEVHLLAHGTTLHGAQATSPAFKCRPTNYYAPQGAIAQAYALAGARRPAMKMGVVGLGAGSVAAYMRPGDVLRFFEIDGKVEELARDRRYFTYMSDCAKGPVDVVLGDARLTLSHEPPGSYDLIHLDAFSSDAIPTHLLTAEAIDQYLKVLKPDGVLLLHISNRHLALEGPAAAAARKVGAQAMMQQYRPVPGTPVMVTHASDVMVVSRSPEAIAQFAADPRWRPAQAGSARAWTDDYTNVVGALFAKSFAPKAAKPD